MSCLIFNICWCPEEVDLNFSEGINLLLRVRASRLKRETLGLAWAFELSEPIPNNTPPPTHTYSNNVIPPPSNPHTALFPGDLGIQIHEPVACGGHSHSN